MLNCPKCNLEFKLLLANHNEIPDCAPILCERCLEVGLFIDGVLRTPTEAEFHYIKQSEAWKVIERARDTILRVRKARNAPNN